MKSLRILFLLCILITSHLHSNFIIKDDACDAITTNFFFVPAAAPLITSATFITATKVAAAASFVGGYLCYVYTLFYGTLEKNNNNHHQQPLNNNNDNPCWCGHACNAGCTCKCLCNCNKKNSMTKTVDDLLKECTSGDRTNGRSKQFIKSGGYRQALIDFYSLNPSEVKDFKNGKVGKVGILADGRTANVRMESSDERPTLEILNPLKKKSIKIRYNP